jgi:hypothetical protein
VSDCPSQLKDTTVWIRSAGAADLLGVSVRRVQAVARSGAVVTRRGPGRCWLFDRQSLVAWSVLVPAPRRRPARPSRYVSPDRRPHVELLGTVGVPDEVLANRLGVKLSTVRRWHRRGVPNLYVAQLRSLATPGKRR